MKWGPAEVIPSWSSPDITYQRVGREVLYNPWFPKQVQNLKILQLKLQGHYESSDFKSKKLNCSFI